MNIFNLKLNITPSCRAQSSLSFIASFEAHIQMTQAELIDLSQV